MKKYALISAIALATTVFSTNAQEVVNSDSTGFKFTDVKVAKSTPVTNQNKSGTCWCFSANTFLENEIIKATGKEVNLSEMFVVYKCYHDKAVRYIRTNGQIHFEQGGSHLDVPYIWERYGMMPEEAYKGLEYGEAKHDHYEMTDGLKAYIDALKNRKKAKYSTAWLKGLDGILDAYLGEIPATFTVDGKEYTSKSYAESLGIDMNDYVAITSFTHHPFYTTFALEVADNWIWGQYHNVKMEEMKAIVDNAIKKGHTVAWAADVSEKGWQWKNGVALMPAEKTADTLEGTELARWTALSDKDREKERYNFHGYVPEIKVTQEMRQEWFDNYQTTDDHGMVIVGSAVDQDGNRYYKVQNSWDTNQIYKGFIYVSEAYFLAKTLNITVNKNVIPEKIRKNLAL
ncbi:MAG: C1 family peptidase [Muribaculaceae bacterium]|jgi:bleomycin hydrolase|nr:C1 family peptidase [Muribaculaceae bacterium]